MKKFSVFLVAMGLVLYGASPLLAGGVDNKHNWSAEYIRTLNRNAATDSADIAAYNPAGVMQMENGFYGNLSVHDVLKDYKNKVNGDWYSSDVPSYVPGLFAVYKQDKWSAFAAFTIPAGGGEVEYNEGNATTVAAGLGLIQSFDAGANALAGGIFPSGTFYGSITDMKLQAESFYYGYTIGGAYKVNDMVSVSLGLRLIDAHKEAKGHITISPTAIGASLNATDATQKVAYEEDADGWGGIIGIDIVPNKKMNIGIRYETRTKLNFDQNVTKDTNDANPAAQLLPALGVNDGDSVRRDLPALLGLGFSYKFTPKIKVDTTLTYYFQEDADWNGDEDVVSNGFDWGIALEYTFNKKWKGSVGYLYTDTGIGAEDMLPELPELNAHTFGGGAVFTPKPGLDFNFGVGRVFYDDESFTSSTTGNSIEYAKDIYFLAFGIQYKFF